ncbi:MAG: hypothetical protein R2795_06385 [Saprospiraceae bacterium]
MNHKINRLLPFLALMWLLLWQGCSNTDNTQRANIMLFNGYTAPVAVVCNGDTYELAAGAALVVASQQATNEVSLQQGDNLQQYTFGEGQHVINLGTTPLQLIEKTTLGTKLPSRLFHIADLTATAYSSTASTNKGYIPGRLPRLLRFDSSR